MRKAKCGHNKIHNAVEWELQQLALLVLHEKNPNCIQENSNKFHIYFYKYFAS